MQVIKADRIEEAAEQILNELMEDPSSRNNVIYFDGWDGLGASAVLRAIARRLTPTSMGRSSVRGGLEFQQLIYLRRLLKVGEQESDAKGHCKEVENLYRSDGDV